MMKLSRSPGIAAEATRRIDQLRARIVDNARDQEGEQPTRTWPAC